MDQCLIGPNTTEVARARFTVTFLQGALDEIIQPPKPVNIAISSHDWLTARDPNPCNIGFVVVVRARRRAGYFRALPQM